MARTSSRGNELIVATVAWADASPAVIEVLLAVARRGREFLLEHPEEAAKLIADDVDLSPDQLLVAFDKMNYLPAIDEQTVRELDATQRFLHEIGVNRQTIDVNEFVAASAAAGNLEGGE